MAVKRTMLAVAERCGLAAMARRATARRLRILCYHGLWLTPGPGFGECTFISPSQFEHRMQRLKRSGLPVLPLAEAVDLLARDALPDAAVAITIDDGWSSTYTHMLPVLEALELPATLYVTTWYSGRDLPVVNQATEYFRTLAGRDAADARARTRSIERLPVAERLEALRAYGRECGVDEKWLECRQFHIMTPAEIADAAKRGLDIQLHTHRHIDVDRQVDELAREVEENRDFLRAALGESRLEHFCYPSGSWHPRAGELLAASGVRSATLVEEGLNGPDANPLALRRFLDGRRVSDAEFDAYLSGTLHYFGRLRGFVPGRQQEGGARAVTAQC
jgi:peptidoglycan/xylan/chitin deacetylase (PgdA/CDA1 family)